MRLSKRSLIVLSLAIPALIVALVAGFMVHGAAAANTASHTSGAVTVTQASVDGVHWGTADTRTGGAVSFVPGPVPVPLGAGSVQLTTNSGSAQAQLFNYDYRGTALSDLTTLSYSEYRSAASTNPEAQHVSLNIAVFLNTAGPNSNTNFTTLVYEPIYQSGGISALHDNVWENWSALGSGIWWSTHSATGVGNEQIIAGTSYWTWDHIMSVFPNAVILGGLGFNIGSGWDHQFSGNADAFAVGVSGTTTTYNFEPVTDICKNGGWQTYGFKNQGDCVSFIATGGKTPGS